MYLDGALKYRNSVSQYQPNGNGNGYVNPCLQASFDQISTISRPHSTEVGMNQSSSSSMHGRSNGFLSRGTSSNTNGLYEDVDFQPTPRTLNKKKNIVWLRPHVSFAFNYEKSQLRVTQLKMACSKYAHMSLFFLLCVLKTTRLSSLSLP